MKTFIGRIGLFVFAAALIVFALRDTAAAEGTALTPAQRDAVEGVIRDFLKRNPEVVVEAIQAVQAREEQDKKARVQSAIKSIRAGAANDPWLPVSGNPTGDVTVVEYFDYACTYCKKVLPELRELLKADSGVRLVLKEYPILGPGSAVAARVSIAAWRADPKKHNAFHFTLMGLRGSLTEDRIFQIAAESGYDAKALRQAMADPQIEAQLRRNYADAEALQVSGTPSFIIGETMFAGAADLATFKKMVADARAACRDRTAC
ncbi:MAG: DsbA family protein [Rhodospirillales bacterium]|nr:DsbA family protein [Rhodospirillales bacterium]